MNFTGKQNCITAARNNRKLVTEVLVNVKTGSLITASHISRGCHSLCDGYVSVGFLDDTATMQDMESILKNIQKD